MKDKSLKLLILMLFLAVSMIFACDPGVAAAAVKLESPPLGERWFGIYVDNERVGFYRQNIDSTSDGYRFEGIGIVRMKIMGFAKDSSFRDSYMVTKSLAIRSFNVEQKVNGIFSKIKGQISDATLRLETESEGGKNSIKIFRGLKSDIIPASALNLYPLMRDNKSLKSFKIQVFDSEEVKIKEVKVAVLGEEHTPEGQQALKFRNNLYPFSNNDIWVDKNGNTLYESVREGLVITRPEDPKILGAFVGNLLIARKDLIHDFSLVRTLPPIKDQRNLKGLAVEVSGWDGSLPLQQDGLQVMEKLSNGRLLIRTGTAIQSTRDLSVTDRIAELSDFSYLRAAKNIESDAPEIISRAKELAAGSKNSMETVKTFAIWTADYLKDSLDGSIGAQAALNSKSGNAQAHARLFTALARAAGIPARYVAGLISLEGRGFVYHSWAECLLGGKWIPVDPTYGQAPADPAHLRFVTGDTYDDIAPLGSMIGRLIINVLEVKYN